MTNEECFEAWAPDESHWSQWSKPVLFANLDRIEPARSPSGDWRALELGWLPDPRGDAAIVVDLPGEESALTGLALARRGWRPVPLYNATVGPSAVIDLEPVARCLRTGLDVLREMNLTATAPPAFLLDANRMSPAAPPSPGKFDNRWIVFPQDFPSATYLRARGINEVLLLQLGDDAPREDLAHVLLRWQRAGIGIRLADAKTRARPRELLVRPPSLFRRAWYRTIALMGLRRNNAGGFGGVIPVPSSGG